MDAHDEAPGARIHAIALVDGAAIEPGGARRRGSGGEPRHVRKHVCGNQLGCALPRQVLNHVTNPTAETMRYTAKRSATNMRPWEA